VIAAPVPARRRAAVVLAACVSGLFLLGGAAVAGKAPKWTIADVGTPPHHPEAFMIASAVNDRGEVVGEAWEGPLGHQQSQGFAWRNGRMTLLSYAGSTWVDVTAINARGDVAGDEASADGSQSSVLWRGGKPLALGTLGGKSSTAIALNDRDQVVGESQTADGKVHSFIWQDGTMTDLGTLGGDDAHVVAINNAGQVIGNSTTAAGPEHAFLWQNGSMTDLGSLNGNDSSARAINESGEVVGGIQTHVGQAIEAVAWKNGQLMPLGRFGRPGAQAIAINRRGDILIEVENNGGHASGGILLRGGKATTIGTLGGAAPPGQGGPVRLAGLNDRDQVAGFGYAPKGGRRTFIWQSGHMTILPTFDGVSPPWGDPKSLNNNGVLIGTSYVSRGSRNFQHVVVWRA
jgi:probable HAF family extracellular repeat protein